MRIAVTALLVASLLSCRKELEVAPSAPTLGKSITADNTVIDWENIGIMPTGAGSPEVKMPWLVQSGTYVEANIISDYHKKDGWDLVYNTFRADNPVTGRKGVIATKDLEPAGGLYFALYNRFRGILRYYLYVPTGYYGASTQITHGLSFYSDNGSTTKMLNFNGVDIVDPAASVSGFTSTAKEGIASAGGWVALQYQIAFDPTSTNGVFPNKGLAWDSHNISITAISLDGQEEGTMHGTITTPAPKFDWLNAAEGVVEVLGTVFLTSGTGISGNFASAASGGLAGSTAGVLNGLFGGNSASSQTVDLVMSSTIKTTGTAVTGQPFAQNLFIYPSGSSTNTFDEVPLISYPMGVFNLSGRPKVHLQTNTGPPPQSFFDPTYVEYFYTSDVNEVMNIVQWNGSVFNSSGTGASYSNFKVETVIPNPAPQGGGTWSVGGRQETMGSKIYYSAYPTVPAEFDYQGPGRAPFPGAAYVRVSFNIKSNDSAGPQNIFVVKTFAADVVQ